MATVAGYTSIQVDSLTPHIGAQISGVALGDSLSNEQFSEIYRAWLDWKVLVFRDQHLDGEQHKAFARRFGTLHVHPCSTAMAEIPKFCGSKPPRIPNIRQVTDGIPT